MELGIFIFFIAAAIVIRLIAGNFDSDRIAEEISKRGGKLISKTWEPFGKGWYGEKNDRIYKVIYLDKDGNTHEAYVKTSMMSGVYFAEDTIIQYGKRTTPANTVTKLQQENEQLRKEIERLKNNQNKS